MPGLNATRNSSRPFEHPYQTAGRVGNFVRDFAAVFHDQDPKRVSFMYVNAVKRTA
jgi:hypothetical protein